MATRKDRLSFTFKRLRNTMSQVLHSKRGALGFTLICLFVIIGVFAPLISPYDPIKPFMDPGEYPAYGVNGPKIAEKLCYPSWYKYVPWIHKGSINVTETFNSTVIVVMGQKFSNVTSLQLRKRIAKPLGIKVIFKNGSSKILSDKEWRWDPKKLRVMDINWKAAGDLPNGTLVEANYLTGLDISDTIVLMDDYKFSSKESCSVLENQTNNPNLVSIRYNSQNGTEDDGCMQITYLGSKHNTSDGEVNATFMIPFEYSYWTPPASFDTHFSAHVEATVRTDVIIRLWMRNEILDETFLIAAFPLNSSGIYIHKHPPSTNNETKVNIGSYPERSIFPLPANMSYGLTIDFPNKEKDVTVYIDNFQCILYGNSFGLLGTDNGSPYPPRDIFSTLVHGTRVSLVVGILSALFSTTIGLFLGLIAGYVGGITDETVMRFADLLLVLPTLPLFIVLISVMSATYGLVSMWNIIILITFFGWMGFSRSVRSMVLSIRERPFIEAAKAAGGGKFYIITKHMIPNVFPLVYVTLATSVPGAIITEASLSWLGLGDKTIPSWGKVLYDFNVSGIAVTKGLTEYWFWIFPPCVSIAILATAFILLGFALDEILNPRLRQRR